MSDPRIVVALDYPDAASALAFAARVTPDQCRLKVGKELFTVAGPQLVEALIARGFDVFLDLKFHDIPNTVAQACKMAAGLGVWMVNVHASGGRKMMETTRDVLEGLPQRPLLIAVTVLTSMDAAQLAEIGLPEPAVQVERLARLTRDCGLDGVVCSAQEAAMLKAACGRDFKLVTPGIRPADAALDDQSRVMTPQAAIAAGSDYLVIGRPITQSADPLATLQTINQSLEAA
ncbi:orotidine-5'-phosphate decarboxylase [Andreprevotia lacus DSM 23236]|jgi:orotidine-5'-phosphate decarboxylase|uniref:Orotidine 5'-phosphate decarboxylase n=1 Tax=Andreprevotia lacus DSM 23236 TaxID=1121001 RepID=A0A1W1XHU3_9NEIS|nr:orotidine-5'-phosphate decarboxylase [Andreprevotia lacus]SMC23555.1 orotidine-5'-phosphate decarboxylase [Andreprevotia lacus DSM 23236]